MYFKKKLMTCDKFRLKTTSKWIGIGVGLRCARVAQPNSISTAIGPGNQSKPSGTRRWDSIKR